MCIIIAKPQGAKLPPYKILENCARRNPDGFGFATVNGCYHFMNFDTFCRCLEEAAEDRQSLLIHFRWATHGSIGLTNCHPFRDDVTGVSFAHNGILNIKPYKDMTDSETAFRGPYVPKIRRYGLDSDELAYEVYQTIGYSRFAFLGQDSQIRCFGPFYEFGGCKYSNANFM